MATLQQISLFSRSCKQARPNSPKLAKNPQRKAICLKLLTLSPKKPNSANRRIAKIRFVSNKMRLTVKISGEGHNLQQHSTILINGSKFKDLIGVSYSAIRGVFDLSGVVNRKRRRSVYGVKKSV